MNGRGDGKHAGKIHYHMEYLAKRAEGRVFHRKLSQAVEVHADLPNSQVQEIDLFAMVSDIIYSQIGRNILGQLLALIFM